MAIHGFAFWKIAKPADEHHLQASPKLSKPYSHAPRQIPGYLEITTPNNAGKGKKLVTAFAAT
jgi:hypothetical protein